MGSQEFNDRFHAWLNEKTNNLLKEQADAQQLSPETAAALVSALYLKAAWAEKFSADLTDQSTFTTPEGEIETEMMHSREYGDVYQAEGWKAHALSLSDLGSLWLYLPEEGTSLQEILSDPDAYELAQGEDTDLDLLRGDVILSVPKLDLKSGRSIADELKELGLGSLFTGSADFSNLSENEDMCVSDIYHAAALKTDEEGLEAAAFTVISMKTTGLITEVREIEFNCDRPFVFILSGQDGAVLMSGTVYRPVQQ
jgi:serpin B